MTRDSRIKVGIIGSQFQAMCHAEAFRMISSEAEVVAIASPTAGHAKRLADRYDIPQVFTDYRNMMKQAELDVVTIAAPNYLHAQMTVDIANAGKHVICEKPLCMNLQEADLMIAACEAKGVLLMYAEELFFTPKYVRAKQMADEGAFGKVYLVKQCEKHFGPHADWFWNMDLAGGGAVMDLGCHGIAFCSWFLGRPPVKSVYAQLNTHVHADKTRGDDDAVCIIEFDGGAVGIVENSWCRRGGMEDRIEVYGEGGVTYANLHMGNALPTYSEYGYGYAVEKAPTTKGWTYPVFEEFWNYGFPQEMLHFVNCIRGREQLQSTALDGKTALEVIFAAYESAAKGRKIPLPFTPPQNAKPIDLWRKP